MSNIAYRDSNTYPFILCLNTLLHILQLPLEINQITRELRKKAKEWNYFYCLILTLMCNPNSLSDLFNRVFIESMVSWASIQELKKKWIESDFNTISNAIIDWLRLVLDGQVGCWEWICALNYSFMVTFIKWVKHF